MFLLSATSASVGALINGTYRFASYDERLVSLETTIKPDRLAQLEIRLTSDEDRGNERRITAAADYSQIAQRVGILEHQVQFLGDLEHDAMSDRLAAQQAKHR